MSLFFSKKGLSDVRSEIHLVRCDIGSTGESVRAWKKLFPDLYRNKYTVRASTVLNNCFVNYFSLMLEKQPLEEVYKISCT